MDGYSYPVSAYTERGRKLYSYRCEICGGIINGYAKMRVKGRITCYSCKKEIAKKPLNITKVKDGNKYVGLIGKCPCCNDIVDKSNIVCDCGQKLDWSDEE